uniref:Putative secreted protein n=1 Tax=Anopheles marajoara TaxID=58244 RepID=A0A2M4C631_9DIPT
MTVESTVWRASSSSSSSSFALLPSSVASSCGAVYAGGLCCAVLCRCFWGLGKRNHKTATHKSKPVSNVRLLLLFRFDFGPRARFIAPSRWTAGMWREVEVSALCWPCKVRVWSFVTQHNSPCPGPQKGSLGSRCNSMIQLWFESSWNYGSLWPVRRRSGASHCGTVLWRNRMQEWWFVQF